MFAYPKRENRKTRSIQKVSDRVMLFGVAAGSLIVMIGLAISIWAMPSTQSFARQPVEMMQAAELARMLAAPQTTALPMQTLMLMSGGLLVMLAASAAFAASLRTDFATSRAR